MTQPPTTPDFDLNVPTKSPTQPAAAAQHTHAHARLIHRTLPHEQWVRHCIHAVCSLCRPAAFGGQRVNHDSARSGLIRRADYTTGTTVQYVCLDYRLRGTRHFRIGFRRSLRRTTQGILKCEIRNSKQIRSPKFEGPKQMITTDAAPVLEFRAFEFRICLEFRASSLGFPSPLGNCWQTQAGPSRHRARSVAARAWSA